MILSIFLPVNRLFRFSLITIALIIILPFVATSAEYYDNDTLGRNIKSLAQMNSDLVYTERIAQSMGERSIWLIEVGKGVEENRKTRPAVLVVAGIEGNDLIGSSVIMSWLKYLVEQYDNNTEIAGLLETTTIYAIPRLNPDAAEHFFSVPKFETSWNDKPVDNDHDGLIDEDGPEDLNGDGLITWMRVEDPEGEYIQDSVDDRLLLKADRLKGEVGAWRYFSEGIDNDNDELWNEDGLGGVNFNRNFPYNFQFFAPHAGLYQICEVETRALADFVVEHLNIGIVLTYGAADNLLKTPASSSSEGRREPMTGIQQEDVGYYQTIGKIYREALGLEEELDEASLPGTFSDWMYYHRGRLSLAANAWNPLIALELSKPTNKQEETAQESEEAENSVSEPNQVAVEKAEEQDSESEQKNNTQEDAKPDKDKRNEKERKILQWFDQHAPESFIKWQTIKHQDFPDQRVEVGGYSPFALTNPPVDMIEEITSKHVDFLTAMAQKLPRIGIRKTEIEHLGQSVYEIKIQVENTGFLPTSLTHGRTTGEVYPTRLVMELDDKFFLSGTRITNLPVIQGSGGMVEIRQIIQTIDDKTINFKVNSMLAGQVEGTIELLNTQ